LITDPPPAKRRWKIRGTDVQPRKTSIATPQPTQTPAAKAETAKSLTEGQRAYEAKRAAKAGMSLDKWLASKEREREAEAKAKLKAVQVVKPPKPPGLLGRLLERAQRPLGS
jgi:hypothetical protein